MESFSARRKPLTYASTSAFELATAGITDPIMAIITTTPQQFGVKVSGSYTYHKDQQSAVDYLQSQINGLSGTVSSISSQVSSQSAAISTLQSGVANNALGISILTSEVSTLPGLGVGPLGMVNALTGEDQQFVPYTITSIPTPQLFCRINTDFSEYGIFAVYLSTALVQETRLDETPLGAGVEEDGGGFKFVLYRYINSALLGEVVFSDATAPVPIKADGSNVTLGYVIRDVDAVAVAPFAISVDVGSFSVAKDSLGDRAVSLHRGAGAYWEFDLDNYINAPSLSSIDYTLKLGNQDLTGGLGASFLTAGNTSGLKRFVTKIRVTYVGAYDSGIDTVHAFRTEVYPKCWGGLPFTTETYKVVECDIAGENLPQYSFFDFGIFPNPDSSAIGTFYQIRATATKTPSLVL